MNLSVQTSYCPISRQWPALKTILLSPSRKKHQLRDKTFSCFVSLFNTCQSVGGETQLLDSYNVIAFSIVTVPGCTATATAISTVTGCMVTDTALDVLHFYFDSQWMYGY